MLNATVSFKGNPSLPTRVCICTAAQIIALLLWERTMAGARGGGGREQMKKWRPVTLAGASGPVETPHSHQDASKIGRAHV